MAFRAGQANPALSGTAMMSVALMVNTFGWEYIQKLKAETANLQKVLGEAGSIVYQEAQKKYAEEQAAKQATAEKQ
jgi:hypothetical protein